MHDIRFIESHLEDVKKNLTQRGFDLNVLEEVIELNAQKKKTDHRS